MKKINCDRCGKSIPYVPPFINVAKSGTIPCSLMINMWDSVNNRLVEVDLCHECEDYIRNAIFEYKPVRLMKEDKK